MHGVSPIRMQPAECTRSLRDAMVVDAAPVDNPLGVAMAMVLRRHGVSLLLTGDAGDDVLGGDMRVFVDCMWRGHPVRAIRDAARLKAWGRSTPWSRIKSLVLHPSARRLMPEHARAILRAVRRPGLKPSWAGPELRRVLVGGALDRFEPPRQERSSERSWLDYQSRSSLYMYCSDARAQMELVGSFLRVDPLLDAEVVDFVASLCPEQLFHGNCLRGLYREALKGWVPESLRLRTDKGGFGPAVGALGGGVTGLAALGDLARCGRLADLGIVEPRAFWASFERLLRMPHDAFLWAELLPVLSAEAFLETLTAAST